MSGAPGLTAVTTAIEGQRLLMKVTARQWAQHGVRVNCVAVSTELVLPQLQESKALSTLRRVAYMGAGDLGPSYGFEARTEVDRDLIPLVSFLACRSPVQMTGQTIVADGGAWMVP
jgi:NAD(P)-dependent dehydrogenase (short-subunit alcohol dehydrogenase family)